ncbi:MAG: hypothetical protein SV062_02580 [Thermodesulfobacteriota bacterium]|nr:hypothetical protein [Thermodesulfobacteriota bacterium]
MRWKTFEWDTWFNSAPLPESFRNSSQGSATRGIGKDSKRKYFLAKHSGQYLILFA